ncbi:hypothetical protein M9H77_29312 [Catharanthus roseus]|uniref:Uncharacterized protein n=1 Tax=Catharanthus roseus TaxID=4058 RepID=A0ACC0AI66_CATRO|nr:hypothetical protein M9H77_29312 [Catharanthus roseus]
MAACSFWASGIKVSSLNYSSTGSKLAALEPAHGLLTTSKKVVRFDGLAISVRPMKGLTRCCQCKTTSKAASDEVTSKSDESPEETSSTNAVSKLIPNPTEVESLVSDICDTTSIAEFELKLGGFRLYIKRNLTQENTTLPAPVPVSAPISVSTDIDLANRNGSASSTSLALYKPEPAPSGIKTFLDKAADDGIAILQSPKVGFFRRSRTIKGKRAPPSCKEKQEVKEGQVLCYIEQLGGEIPVESDISGEVIRILREDGDPIGYGDALIAILPSFPGIKKLQ